MNTRNLIDSQSTVIARVLTVLLIGLAVIAFVGMDCARVEAGWYKDAKKKAKKAAKKAKAAAEKAGKNINKEANRAVDNVSREANKFSGDVKREASRFNTDLNREITKFENDYSREVRKFGNDIARETRGSIADAQAQSQRGISFGSFKLGENMAAGQQRLGYNLTRGKENLGHNIDRGVGGLGNNLMPDPYWKEGAPFWQRVMNVPVVAVGAPLFNPASQHNLFGGVDRLGRNVGDAWRQVGDAANEEGHRAQERIFGSPKVTDTKASNTDQELPTGKVANPLTERRVKTGDAMESTGGSTNLRERTPSGLGTSAESSSRLSNSGASMKKEQSSSSDSPSQRKASGLPKRR